MNNQHTRIKCPKCRKFLFKLIYLFCKYNKETKKKTGASFKTNFYYCKRCDNIFKRTVDENGIKLIQIDK